MKSTKEKIDFLTDKLLAYGPSKKTLEREAENKPKKKAKKSIPNKGLQKPTK